MKRCKIIVNPVSGRGAGEQAVPAIQGCLDSLGMTYDLCWTEAPGHALQLAEAAAADGWEIVAAVGGDGTVNEVVNGLARSRLTLGTQAALAVIPVGRGNDFCFGMGIPVDPMQACQVLAGGIRRQVDVGLVQGGDFPDGRYFANGVGIGFDAVVGFEALKLKRLSGFPSYIVAALKTIFLYFKAPTLRIELDDQTIVQPSLMVSVMNGCRMGGGFRMAPDSLPDDGMFDICIVEQVSKPGILALIPKFMQGTQAAHPAVRMLRSKSLIVTALKGALPAHADGETLCTAGDRLVIMLVPADLDVLVPRQVPAV